MKNQADLRIVNKELDRVVSSNAMRAKVEDCKQVLILKKKEKKKSIKQFLQRVNFKGFKLRKTVIKIKQLISSRRKNLQLKK